MGFELKVLTT